MHSKASHEIQWDAERLLLCVHEAVDHEEWDSLAKLSEQLHEVSQRGRDNARVEAADAQRSENKLKADIFTQTNVLVASSNPDGSFPPMVLSPGEYLVRFDLRGQLRFSLPAPKQVFGVTPTITCSPRGEDKNAAITSGPEIVATE